MAKRKKDKLKSDKLQAQTDAPAQQASASDQEQKCGQTNDITIQQELQLSEQTGPVCAKNGCRISLPTFIGGIFLTLVLGLYLGSLIPGMLEQKHPQMQSEAQPPKAQQAATAPQSGPDLNPELKQAIADLEKRAAANPDSAPVWINLGNIYFDAHMPDKAVQAYEHALHLAPDNADVLTDLGIMYREKGEYEKAVGAFRKAIAIDQHHQNAMFNEGVVLANDLHKKAEAAQAWQRLLDVNPGAKAPDGTPLAEMISKLR